MNPLPLAAFRSLRASSLTPASCSGCPSSKPQFAPFPKSGLSRARGSRLPALRAHKPSSSSKMSSAMESGPASVAASSPAGHLVGPGGAPSANPAINGSSPGRGPPPPAAASNQAPAAGTGAKDWPSFPFFHHLIIRECGPRHGRRRGVRGGRGGRARRACPGDPCHWALIHWSAYPLTRAT